MADLNTVKGSGRWLDATTLLSDSADLPEVPRGIYVGVSGNVKMNDGKGNTVTFVGLAAGVEHALHPRRIWSTGTTATSVNLLY